jgi:hypothetical protein
MKYRYATDMGSGAKIYIPSFIKIGSGIENLWREGEIIRHRQAGNSIYI